jgi:hypothetical protein
MYLRSILLPRAIPVHLIIYFATISFAFISLLLLLLRAWKDKEGKKEIWAVKEGNNRGR